MKRKTRGHRTYDPRADDSSVNNNNTTVSNGYVYNPCLSEKQKSGKVGSSSFFFGRISVVNVCRILILGGIAAFFTIEGIFFVTNSASLSSSSSLRSFALQAKNIIVVDENDDLPPADLVVHGSRDVYTPCPPEYRKQAFLGLRDSNIVRAFRHEGWTISKAERDAKAGKHHIMYRHGSIRSSSDTNTTSSNNNNDNGFFSQGQPWQRYSRIPGSTHFEQEDLFHAGFREFQQKYEAETKDDASNNMNGKNKKDVIYFLPETYELGEEEDRKNLLNVLKDGKETGNERPWVLKKVTENNETGIAILLPPNGSQTLYSSIARVAENKDNQHVVQSYVCNQLTWFGGEKFDLRFYWLIASVDPLIAMYHDGYARVAGTVYNESDFNSTVQHLKSHGTQVEVHRDVLADDVWRRVMEHYEANKGRLSKLVIGGDPVRHVRNQMKEAISATAAAFKDVLTLQGPKNTKVTTENLFGFYGADFIIDEDLDIYYVNAHVSPELGDRYDYRVELFRDLLRPMTNIVEEIAIKQEQDAKGNILPIESAKGWDLVYAGDEWRYQYKGYERSKHKAGCKLKMP